MVKKMESSNTNYKVTGPLQIYKCFIIIDDMYIRKSSIVSAQVNKIDKTHCEITLNTNEKCLVTSFNMRHTPIDDIVS